MDAEVFGDVCAEEGKGCHAEEPRPYWLALHGGREAGDERPQCEEHDDDISGQQEESKGGGCEGVVVDEGEGDGEQRPCQEIICRGHDESG